MFWPRWISRCRFDFRAFVTLASAMRVQPPILVPCFAKQIRVVFHNAPSMIMILARVARSTGFSILFPKSELTDSSFSRRDLTLHCVSSHFVPCVCFELFVSRMCRRCMCVVREARDVSR